MALTISQIESGLDHVGNVLANAKAKRTNGRAQIVSAVSDYTNLPTQQAALITEINALPSTGYNTTLKARLAAFVAEYQAQSTAAQAEVDALAALD